MMSAKAVDHSDLLARAAVRGLFDAQKLVEGRDEPRAALIYLAQRSSERQLGERWLWMLNFDSREEGLASLPQARHELLAFLARNRPDQGDVIGEMFQRVLGANTRKAALAQVHSANGLSTSPLSADEQVRLYQVVAALLESNAAAREWLNEDLKQDIRRSAALQDRLDAQKTVLPGALRGRSSQSRFLLDFVTKGADRIIAHAKGVDLVEASRPDATPVVLVTGVGGIGKSALLADVTRKLFKSDLATVIDLDFDNPALRQGDILAIAMEFSRQLALVDPAVEQMLSGTRREMRYVAERVDDAGYYELVTSVMLGVYSTWREALNGRAVLENPLVIVLDTFEEVVIAAADRLERIADWAKELSGVGFRRVNLIIAGRAVEDLVIGHGSPLQVVAKVALGDLGPTAGRAKLNDMFERHGIPQLDLIPALVDAFGSNPLVLEVLARYCIDKTDDEIASLLVGREAGSTPREGQFGAIFAQRFLYSRILERLPSGEMRKLAQPGLVLRRVTPELIMDVLAEPCGLVGVDQTKALDLLTRMKRVAWLVQPGGNPDEAVHRRDLRRIMLPLLLEDPASAPVIAAAVRYFGARPESDARLEALYYRALSGDELDECSSEELRGLADLIGSDVEDLPLELRARVKRSARQKLNSEEIASLPDPDRAEIYEGHAATLVSEGLESAALSVGDQAPGRPLPPSKRRRSKTSQAEEDAETWRFELSRSSDGQSRFNIRQFNALADRAAPLVRHLLRSLANGESRQAGKKLDNLAHPAYLATLATFASGRQAAVDQLRYFLKEFNQHAALASAIRSGLARPVDGRGEFVLALLCVHALGMDLQELPGFEQADAPENVRWSGPTAQAAWRISVVLARYGLVRTLEPSLDVFPLLSDTMSRIVTPRSPLREAMLVPGGSNASLSIEPSSLDGLVADWPESGGHMPQATITRLKRVASRSTVRFEFGLSGGRLPEHLALGRIPELRGPLRSELRSMPTELLEDMVEILSSNSAIWPVELTLARAGKDGMAKLVPPLVEAIDDSGQWARVVPMLNRQKGTGAIIDGMRLLWTDYEPTPMRR